MAREYKDSGIAWIGEIPEGWKICRIKDIFILRTGTTPKDYEKWLDSDSLVNWFTPSDISEMNCELYSSERHLSKKVVINENIKLHPVDSLLFVGIGASAGKIGFAKVESYSNQQITNLVPKKEKCYSKYFYYYMLADRKRIRDNAFFTTLPIINNSYLSNISILSPSIIEQRAIADYLDRKCGEIDELISLQEKMIEELKAYKQSVITEAVTKGLNPDVPMKDSGIEWIGEIPEGWRIKPLKWIVKSPLQYGANESGVIYDENLPRYVRITDISNNQLREDIQKQSLTESQANGYILENNDILFARSGGTVGKSFIYSSNYGRCAFAGYLIRAQINKDNNPKYIYYYTQSCVYEEWKRQIFIQATIQNIGADRYSLLDVSIPPLSEQQAIADYLDNKCSEIDSLIALKQKKIEELKEYKKSMIYEYVTGKKEV